MAPAPLAGLLQPRDANANAPAPVKDVPSTYKPKMPAGNGAAPAPVRDAPAPEVSASGPPARGPAPQGEPRYRGPPSDGPPDQVDAPPRSGGGRPPPGRGPPGRGPPGKVNPKADVKQRCFKTADETTICVADTVSTHNTTDVYEQNGVSDRHNDYHNAATHDVAGKITGQNGTEAMRADGSAAGRPGNTKFESSTFKENGGFRDTHREDPQNGRTFNFEDHKEDSKRSGKDYQAHGSGPDGSRMDAQGHVLNESHVGVDVKDKNGATDSTHKETNGSELQSIYQKHHGGPDQSDAHDSKVTNSANAYTQHQKAEHKDDQLHTLHEESSGRGSVSVHIVGDHALSDLASEANSWPKGSKDWSTNAPRDLSHIKIQASTAEQLDNDAIVKKCKGLRKQRGHGHCRRFKKHHDKQKPRPREGANEGPVVQPNTPDSTPKLAARDLQSLVVAYGQNAAVQRHQHIARSDLLIEANSVGFIMGVGFTASVVAFYLVCKMWIRVYRETTRVDLELDQFEAVEAGEVETGEVDEKSESQV